MADDFDYDTEPDLSIIKSEPSPLALYKIVKRYPGEVDLICLAPLTNIAIATRIYDDFMDLVKSVNIMGGNYKGKVQKLHIINQIYYNCIITIALAMFTFEKE